MKMVMLSERVGMTVNRVSVGLWPRVNDNSELCDGRVGRFLHQVGPTRSCLEFHCFKRRWTFEATGIVFVSALSTS